MNDRIEIRARIEQKQRDLPRYVVIPAAVVRGWRVDGTTTVTGAINGTALGRRSLKRWDEARWFVELTATLCRAAGVDVGDTVAVALERADATLPAELSDLLARDTAAAQRWRAMTASQQRMVREEVFAAKGAATRARRAARSLTGPVAPPAPALPKGAARAPLALAIVVDAPLVGVELALQRGRDELVEPTRATRREVRFEFTVDLVRTTAAIDFRGDFVQGPRGSRFVYINSGKRAGQKGSPWDRRAKVSLMGITPALVDEAAGSRLVARIDGKSKDGGPSCASVPLLGGGWSVAR